MICTNCGKENSEESKICAECGEEIQEEILAESVANEEIEEVVEEVSEDAADETAEVAEEAAEECGEECCCCHDEPVKKANPLLKVLAIVIPVVIVIGALVAAFAMGVFKSPAEKAQKAYYDALVSGDGEAMYKLDIDAYELKDVQKGLGVDDEKAVIDMYKESFAQYPDMFAENLGDNIETNIYVAEAHKYTKAEVKKLADHLVEYCDYADGALQDFKVMDVLITISGDKKDQRNYIEEIVACVDGKWYVGAVGDIYNAQTVDQILSGEFAKEQIAPDVDAFEDGNAENSGEEAPEKDAEEKTEE